MTFVGCAEIAAKSPLLRKCKKLHFNYTQKPHCCYVAELLKQVRSIINNFRTEKNNHLFIT